MIEVTLPMVAWVAVVVFQAILHFIILPRQRRALEEEAKADAEILERLREYDTTASDALCSFRATDGMDTDTCAADSCYSNAVLGIDSDERDTRDGTAPRSHLPGHEAYRNDSLMRSRAIGGGGTNAASDPNPADDNSCSSVEDEEEDLDAIDDGLEQSRLKLLRYYYSPSSPDMYQMEPFRSSCGSISSLDESEDPERKVRPRAPSKNNLQQPRLEQRSSATQQQQPIPNGVLRRRNVGGVQIESRKDADIENVVKQVGFADKRPASFAVQSSPIVQCA